MSMLDFSNFTAVKAANTRTNPVTGTGQNFNLKFRKFMTKSKKEKGKVQTQIIQSAFEFSAKLFASLNLADKDTGLIEVVNGGVSYLAIVDNEHAVFLKTNKKNENGDKGKVFKSTILEQALVEQGILVETVGLTQKLDLTLVEGSETAIIGSGESAIQTKGIYSISKAEDAELTEEEKAADTTLEPEVEDEPETIPQGAINGGSAPESAPVAASTASDDDF